MRDSGQEKGLDFRLGRRSFLRICGGGVLGLTLGHQKLWAQDGDVVVSDSPLQGAPGVSSSEVRLGMSAALTGTAAGLGIEYFRGSQAYYDDLNDRGGIFGRKISIVPLDDGYEPVPTINNTIRLVEEEEVFCLINYVGTPTLTRALPVIKRYEDQGVLLVGNFTGAQPQREEPYTNQVFNICASYRQEMMALVDQFWEAGIRKFGVFYQIDAYGRSGTDGVAQGLAGRGEKILAEATYRRGARYSDDMSAAVGHLRKAGVEAVLCTGAYQGCGAFIRACREQGWTVPISNVSFVGSDNLLRLLLDTERQDSEGRSYTTNLVNSQVVPSYGDESLPGVVAYRQAMDRWQPRMPAGSDQSYQPSPYSFTSLEGYINARVIGIALQRAGENLTRETFKAGLESLDALDLGIGATINFNSERHQGLDTVYFTRVDGSTWVPVTDWRRVVS